MVASLEPIVSMKLFTEDTGRTDITDREEMLMSNKIYFLAIL